MPTPVFLKSVFGIFRLFVCFNVLQRYNINVKDLIDYQKTTLLIFCKLALDKIGLVIRILENYYYLCLT